MGGFTHEAELPAAPSAGIEAVTTQPGIAGWWCGDSDVESKVGGEVHLRFEREGQKVPMDFRIDEIGEERVSWTCTANANPAWPGTTLTWSFTPTAAGSALAFSHTGWADDIPDDTAQVWKHFMSSLEAFLTTGTGMPA